MHQRAKQSISVLCLDTPPPKKRYLLSNKRKRIKQVVTAEGRLADKWRNMHVTNDWWTGFNNDLNSRVNIHHLRQFEFHHTGIENFHNFIRTDLPWSQLPTLSGEGGHKTRAKPSGLVGIHGLECDNDLPISDCMHLYVQGLP